MWSERLIRFLRRRQKNVQIWNLELGLNFKPKKSGIFRFFNPNVFNPIQFVKTPLSKLQLSSLTSSLKVFGLEVCVSSEEEADIQNLLVFYFPPNFPFIRRRLSMKWRRVPHILYSQTVLSQEKKITFEGFLFKAAAASANPATPTEASKYYSCCSLVTKRENSDRKLRSWPSALLEPRLLIKNSNKKNENKKENAAESSWFMMVRTRWIIPAPPSTPSKLWDEVWLE